MPSEIALSTPEDPSLPPRVNSLINDLFELRNRPGGNYISPTALCRMVGKVSANVTDVSSVTPNASELVEMSAITETHVHLSTADPIIA